MNEQTMFKKLLKACKKLHEATNGQCAESEDGCNGLGYCEQVFNGIGAHNAGA